MVNNLTTIVSTKKDRKILFEVLSDQGPFFETHIKSILQMFCKNCSDKNEQWIYYSLSNGGFFMSPGDANKKYSIAVSDEFCTGVYDNVTLGIILSLKLFADSELEAKKPDDKKRFENLFLNLSEYVSNYDKKYEVMTAIK